MFLSADPLLSSKLLRQNGQDIELFLCVERSPLLEDAAVHASAYEKCGGRRLRLRGELSGQFELRGIGCGAGEKYSDKDRHASNYQVEGLTVKEQLA